MTRNIDIIVIDDQSLIREGISSMLNLEDDITVAGTGENGKEAIELFTKHRPDIVLMDIRMPVMDGIEALKQIKIIDPEAKVLMLTTFDEHDYISRSVKEGALGYLLKDIPIEDLSRAVRLANSGIHQHGPGITEKLVMDKSESLSDEVSMEEKKDFLLYYNTMTTREKEVLLKLSTGDNNTEIAAELNLSNGTVKNYVSNILNAFDLNDRTQAALLAYKFHKFIESDLEG